MAVRALSNFGKRPMTCQMQLVSYCTVIHKHTSHHSLPIQHTSPPHSSHPTHFTTTLFPSNTLSPPHSSHPTHFTTTLFPSNTLSPPHSSHPTHFTTTLFPSNTLHHHSLPIQH